MPVYEFGCSQCGHVTALQCSITDTKPAPKCMKCDVLMRRTYDAPAAIFRGTGWGKDKK